MVKKRTGKRGFIAGFITLMLASIFVYVGCGYHTPEKRVDRIVKRITKELDLNEAQQKKLEESKIEFLAKGREMREAHQNMRKELHEQLSGDKVDQQLLLKIYAENKLKMDEIVFLFTKRLAEFHSTLSPEQKTKLLAKLDDLEKKHRRWHCRHR